MRHCPSYTHCKSTLADLSYTNKLCRNRATSEGECGKTSPPRGNRYSNMLRARFLCRSRQTCHSERLVPACPGLSRSISGSISGSEESAAVRGSPDPAPIPAMLRARSRCRSKSTGAAADVSRPRSRSSGRAVWATVGKAISARRVPVRSWRPLPGPSCIRTRLPWAHRPLRRPARGCSELWESWV